MIHFQMLTVWLFFCSTSLLFGNTVKRLLVADKSDITLALP